MRTSHKNALTAVAAAAIETLESRTHLSTTWYVANDGNDAADGSVSAPLASIQAALNHAQSGDTVMLRQGNYSGGFRIDTPGLTLTSAPGEMASISLPNDDPGQEVTIRIGEDAHHTTLADLDISGGYYYAVKSESTWDSGLPDPHGPSYLKIRDSKLHDSGADVIKLTPGTDYSKIARNEIYNSGRTGPDNAEGIDAVNANYAIVRANSVHDTTTNGIYYKGGSRNTLIERNRVWNTAHSGILLGQSSDEVWFDTNVNPGYFESIDGIVRDNIVWDTQGAGIGAWAALRPTIHNNTLINVAQSMFGGLLVQGQEHWLPSGGDWVSTIIPSQDVSMYNNIVTVSSDRPVMEVREQGLVGNLTLANNLYHQNGGRVLFRDAIAGFEGGMAAYRAQTGREQGSINADPMVNADASFDLTGSSPAINAGLEVGEPFDFNREARILSGRVDIGAHEFA